MYILILDLYVHDSNILLDALGFFFHDNGSGGGNVTGVMEFLTRCGWLSYLKRHLTRLVGRKSMGLD